MINKKKYNLSEEWSYNEWPDVDIDGNVISAERKLLHESKLHDRRRSLTESKATEWDVQYYEDAGKADKHIIGKAEFWKAVEEAENDCDIKNIFASNGDGPNWTEEEGLLESCRKSVKECDMQECDQKPMTEGKKVKTYVHYGKDSLPDAWADTADELAAQLGVKPNTVRVGIMNGDPHYAKVIYDEDDEFEDIKVDECADSNCEESFLGKGFLNNNSISVNATGNTVPVLNNMLGEECDDPDCEDKEESEENKYRDLVDEEGNELYEAKKDEESEKPDFNAVVKDALDAIIPEGDEEFDIHVLADAVINYFDDETKEYIKSVLCPDDEEEADAEIEEISEEE